MDVRKQPKSQLRYGLYNWGNLCSVHIRRREAREEAERHMDKPWSECTMIFEVHKVRVEKFTP